jgi:Cu+-exporting ATPase
VIACPCAWDLPPVAVAWDTGNAARGILIKGGDILERMHNVDTVVLDKTGTITTGRMSVSELLIADCGLRNLKSEIRNPRSEILQYASSAEQGSEHLMGQAMVNYAKEQGIELYKSDSFKAVPGQGVKATVNGASVLVGKRVFLENEGILISRDIIIGEKLNSTAAPCMGLPGQALLGIIALVVHPAGYWISRGTFEKHEDKCRHDCGDNQNTAQAVAARDGDRVRSCRRPASGKSEKVSRLREKARSWRWWATGSMVRLPLPPRMVWPCRQARTLPWNRRTWSDAGLTSVMMRELSRKPSRSSSRT